jgi:hypothetical protein
VPVTRRRALAALAIAAMAAAIAYLRDPPWLVHMESGFRGRQTGPDGIRYRWTDGHASFFVPVAATSLTIPIRAAFEQPGDPPVLVSLAIDDRPADAFVLKDDRWVARRLRMPPPGSRKHRRIDVRVDRLRGGNRGVQIGEVEQGR